MKQRHCSFLEKRKNDDVVDKYRHDVTRLTKLQKLKIYKITRWSEMEGHSRPLTTPYHQHG